MNKYLSRVTSSARGETFNPLIWPSLISTFIYGVGFTAFFWTPTVGQSSLFIAMSAIHSFIPIVWGVLAVATIVMGITFLLFNIPPAGKVSGLIGAMLWMFSMFCWGLTGAWFVSVAVGLPNLWFWIWQYLSLSKFRREDKEDEAFMAAYDAGEYDSGQAGRQRRESNRGVDPQ